MDEKEREMPMPRVKYPAMTRTQWLTRRAETAAMMDALGLEDDDCGCISTLRRVAHAASPWQMVLPYRAWVAAYGLLWAMETGRIPGDDYSAIKRLWARPLCEFVADIAAACPSPLDVPHYVIARDPGKHDHDDAGRQPPRG